MSGYTDVFTQQLEIGSNSILDLQLIDATPYVFYWPAQNKSQAEVLPGYLRVISSVVGSGIVLPDATNGSPGWGFRINNLSSNPISVYTANNFPILTINIGQSYIFNLVDNSTEAGVWDYTLIGTVVSTFDATSLAGQGLQAVSNKLNEAWLIIDLSASRDIGSSDRATIINWVGGAGSIGLINTDFTGDGFFVLVKNNGTGPLSLTPNPGITLDDDVIPKVISPNESVVISNNQNDWYSLLYNKSSSNVFNAINIAVSPSGTQTLTGQSLSAELQTFTGVLSGNLDIDYNSGVGLWFVTNSTSGAYTLTLKATNIDTGVVVPSGANYVVKSDGVTMRLATASAGTVTNINTSGGLTGGPITGSGTISILDTTVTPGSYGGGANIPSITVNSKGQITAASNFYSPMLPPGAVAVWSGAGDPPSPWNNWFLCDARAVSRTTYSVLFSIIGTTYGPGDGSTTFNLPDLRGRYPLGADNMGGSAAGRVTSAGSGVAADVLGNSGGSQFTQAHTHGVNDPGHVHGTTDPGHGHGVNDPGHNHVYSYYSGPGGSFANVNGPNSGGTTITTGTDFAGTGISINANTTGLSVNSNFTGISTQSYGSGGTQNMPPVLVMNYIIKMF